MAVFTRGNYNCACSREVCDWACTTYATMMSDLVPNTASQPFKASQIQLRPPPSKERGGDGWTEENLVERWNKRIYE